MEIDDIEKYYKIFDLFPVVESALEDGDTSTEFEDFMSEELDNLYSTIDELKKKTLIMLLCLKKIL